MPYQRHDKDNAEVTPGLLLDINAYERYTEENALDTQPAFETDTLEGNTWKNWSEDYIKSGINGENLNPEVPIVVDTETTLTGVVLDAARVDTEVTGGLAVFSGGNGALTVEGRFFVDQGGSREDLSNWLPVGDWSTDAVQTYTATAAEIGKEVLFVSRATDSTGEFVYSLPDHVVEVYPTITVTSHTDYTGIKKTGNTINVYTASGEGGIPPINYLIQVRFSDSGSGGWSDQTNIGSNLSPGERVDYVIPEAQAGRYMQIRTRLRDNNGVGGSGVYQQVWSVAADSAIQIGSPITETSGQGAALTGEFRVGQEIGVASIPVFAGGYGTVKYEYQWQKSLNGTSWVGFDSPWTEYDPATILIDGPTKTLNAPEEGYQIRLNARATGADGEQLVVPGIVYGPVVSETPEVFIPTGVVAPLGALDGAYRVGDSVNITKATFTGGSAPYASVTVRLYSGLTRANETLQEWVGAATDGPMIFELQHIHEDLFLYAETIVVDAAGNETISPIVLHNNAKGVLPYEPGLKLVSATEDFGLATPGNTIQVRCGEYSGGIAPQVYHVLLRQSDTYGGSYTQTTIQANAVPGQLYDVPITNDHLNKYLTFVTRVADSGRDEATGYKQRFNIHQLEYPVTIPSSPKASGPRYDYPGYEADLYAEPNYLLGQVLRVGDTITMTVPDFFGGVTPYRYDLSYFIIYEKKSGNSENVYQSAPGQNPGDSVTFTIPQSLMGNYLKVNYYLYDANLTSHKFSFSMYSSNPNSYLEGVIGPALL